MKVLDASFQGCADLQELLQRISSNLDTSQLSQGSLQERLQINNLGFFHLTLLETNKEFFWLAAGAHSPARSRLLSAILNLPNPYSPWEPTCHGLGWGDTTTNCVTMTCDWQRTLHWHAGSFLKSTWMSVINNLIPDISLWSGGNTPINWNYANTTNTMTIPIELVKNNHRSIKNNYSRSTHRQYFSDISKSKRMQVANCQTWNTPHSGHRVAAKILELASKNLTITDLSDVLYQCRRSLFSGWQDHIERTPTGLQRNIRLDLVRQLLLKPKRSLAFGLSDVGAVAVRMDSATVAITGPTMSRKSTSTRRMNCLLAYSSTLKIDQTSWNKSL